MTGVCHKRTTAAAGWRLPAIGVRSCALLLLVVSGCTRPIEMQQAPRISLPVAGDIDQLPPYRLQVGDVLDIRFPLNPELNEQVTVAPDGFVSTTFLPQVAAYGATVSQLRERITTGYRRDLINPRVSVILRSFAPNRVYVAGEVATPGEFISAGPNLTLSQAITRAGGVKFSANRERVFLIRRGKDDRPVVYATNYFGVITGRDPEADIRLAQYDVVYVSRTGIGDAYQFANQYFLQFFPIGATIGTSFIP